jgi:hypothetical protein
MWYSIGCVSSSRLLYSWSTGLSAFLHKFVTAKKLTKQEQCNQFVYSNTSNTSTEYSPFNVDTYLFFQIGKVALKDCSGNRSWDSSKTTESNDTRFRNEWERIGKWCMRCGARHDGSAVDMFCMHVLPRAAAISFLITKQNCSHYL